MSTILNNKYNNGRTRRLALIGYACSNIICIGAPNLLRLWHLVLPDYAEVGICRLLSRHGTSAYRMPCYVTKTAGV